jgi:hypothetical protein
MSTTVSGLPRKPATATEASGCYSKLAGLLEEAVQGLP